MEVKQFKISPKTLQRIRELQDEAVDRDMELDLDTMTLVPRKEYKFKPWEHTDFDRTPRDYEGGADE